VKQIGSTPRFEATKDQILGVLDSDARIPFYERMNDGLYNFWKDKEHPRGLWRRTTLDEYRKDKPNWETLIDVDALGKEEKESWVFHGARCMRPEYQHCLILLSRGGADASVVREYDLKTKSFVKGGFTLPEAKTEVDWIDANTLYVETDFGPGSMTASGYPRVVKQWKRGTPLSAATVVYEAKHEDLTVSASHDPTVGYEHDFVNRSIDFYSTETYVRGKDGKLTLLDIPKDALNDVTRDWLLIQTRSPWKLGEKTYRAP
jgi:prolyl oligopeptidase